MNIFAQAVGDPHGFKIPEEHVEILNAVAYLEGWDQAQLLVRGLNLLVLDYRDNPEVQRLLAIRRGKPAQDDHRAQEGE